MIVLILLLLAITAADEYVSYKDYKVYHVKPSTKEHLRVLKSLKNNTNIDFWTPLYNTSIEPVNIMAAPKFQDQFVKILEQQNISYEITVDDVEEVIIEERKELYNAPPRQSGHITFDRYYNYSEIQAYLYELADKKPNLVSLEDYGRSYEKRKLTLVHIPPENDERKPVIFIDAGMHAREWISPAQVLYIIYMLVQEPNNEWIQNIDFIIIPLINPDGYEYTHTTDRMWRKTRSKGKRCYGVDPNRNFDYQWSGLGSEPYECGNVYAGKRPFSEPETLYLSKVIMRYSKRIKLYLSFHSAAACFLYPWSHIPALPKNHRELYGVASKAAMAILNATGTKYTVGTSYNVLGPAAGSSSDWVYAVARVKLAYVVELPEGHDNIFVIFPEDILGVVKETCEGIKVFFKYIKRKYVSEKTKEPIVFGNSIKYASSTTKQVPQNIFVILFNVILWKTQPRTNPIISMVSVRDL
ncbi:hypothetical protein ILUMI_18826 [Ignelater luminosus]|uniref:Zinc carboxypeptidase A 1 n=1 Tax=Ignelater luminosus TaxID=2038154 RepID=A0A8K0CNG3_IGNLU|nr:hypothetical protein ILUMI_18826 [Ignelater luminosus]